MEMTNLKEYKLYDTGHEPKTVGWTFLADPMIHVLNGLPELG